MLCLSIALMNNTLLPTDRKPIRPGYYTKTISLLFVFLCIIMVHIRHADAYSNPIAGVSFYIDTNNNFAANQAAAWRSTRPADAAQLDKIATQPKAFWMGDWTPNSQQAAADYTARAQAANKVGTIVAYNIPSRDCGSYSSGGSSSHTAYRGWIDGLAAGIGQRRTIVVLEPDALPQISCLDSAGAGARIESLNYAINKLKSSSAAAVYVDIGNKGWLSPTDAASQLQKINISAADGFSLNVSNFYTTAESLAYGTSISSMVGGKHFIIDTSRSGQGSNGQWCNPQGRGLGNAPTSSTGNSLVDAYLWVKGPGESDGSCNGGPAAGSWWADYALGLAQRSALNIAPGNDNLAGSSSVNSSLVKSTAKNSSNLGAKKTKTTLKKAGRNSEANKVFFKLPPTISGTVVVPTYGYKIKIRIDGEEIAGKVINSRHLNNGYHNIAISYIDSSGHIVNETNNTVMVENKLSVLYKLRNKLAWWPISTPPRLL
jgi:cellulase/cellobiase CelA1